MLEWGATFHGRLCRKGIVPGDDSLLRPIIIDTSSKLIDLCNTLQLHRLADLIDCTSGTPQWLTPNPAINDLLPPIPTQIAIPLTVNQFWKSPIPTSNDILQILHWTTEIIHVRRWSPMTTHRMYYSCSPRAEYYAYNDLFPTRHATRFSRLQHETDETLATMFLRRIQPRPQLINAPPTSTPPLADMVHRPSSPIWHHSGILHGWVLCRRANDTDHLSARNAHPESLRKRHHQRHLRALELATNHHLTYH